MIPDPRERPTLSVEEAGAYLSLGRSAAYIAAARGEIPTLKFGRRLAVPTALLLRMLGLDPDPENGEAAAEGPELTLVTSSEALREPE